LIVELMAVIPIIILTAQDGLIIECLRRVDVLMSEAAAGPAGAFFTGCRRLRINAIRFILHGRIYRRF
jgi:hypothetical protein